MESRSRKCKLRETERIVNKCCCPEIGCVVGLCCWCFATSVLRGVDGEVGGAFREEEG